MRVPLKLKLIRWILGKGSEFFLTAHLTNGEEHNGIVVFCLNEEFNDEHLTAILYSAMENRDETRQFILKLAKMYLQRYEVECRNFCKEVYNK